MWSCCADVLTSWNSIITGDLDAVFCVLNITFSKIFTLAPPATDQSPAILAISLLLLLVRGANERRRGSVDMTTHLLVILSY